MIKCYVISRTIYQKRVTICNKNEINLLNNKNISRLNQLFFINFSYTNKISWKQILYFNNEINAILYNQPCNNNLEKLEK